MARLKTTLWIAVCLSVCGLSPTNAEDWPMWRGNAARTASTDHQLPTDLALRWTRHLPSPAPAWPQEQDYHGKLEFDAADQPVASGGRLFVPSSARESLTALDIKTGQELWRFYANGPVRFAPACWEDNVYLVSDDGYLYCLDAKSGELKWKFRGGPAERTLMGNQRLISTWPARGAPVIADNVVYFAAGIWPFMGTFLHGIDTESGEPVWTNSGSGSIYNLHQHGGALAFGGVAPQGYLAVNDEKLIVPGGLTVPAIFDRTTGEFQHFEFSHAAVGKGSGGFDVTTQGDLYFNNGKMYRLKDGKQLGSINAGVLADGRLIGISKGEAIGFEVIATEEEKTDKRGKKTSEIKYSGKGKWKVNLPSEINTVRVQADNRAFATGPEGEIVSFDIPQDGEEGKIAWEHKVDGEIRGMLAASGQLVVITKEGQLYCFGQATDQEVTKQGGSTKKKFAPPSPEVKAQAEQILAAANQPGGYAVVLGLNDGALTEAIVALSDLHVVAIEEDAAKAEKLRRRWDEMGIYGTRAAIRVADFETASLPQYMAELIYSEDIERFEAAVGDQWPRYYESLKPYGGTAILAADEARHEALAAADLHGAKLTTTGDWLAVKREGPLPNSGQWTHQYSNSSNTVYSTEKRVKLPLGVLWFGGPTNQHALPRHAQGPIPQVVGGRLIIEGVNTLSSRCVYTGRELWVREFEDIGFPYKAENHTFTGTVYIKNQPGANYIGSNYASTEDGIYVVYQDECHRLDNATGETLDTFRLPSFDADKPDNHASWGYIGIQGDYLIAGAEPQIFNDERIGQKNWNRTSSQHIVVMNRHTGEVLWTETAKHGFRHNAIVTGGDRLYVVDRLSNGAIEHLQRRGQDLKEPPRMQAFELATGKQVWESNEEVFATWLAYSDKYDVLIQAGRTGGRESLPDETNRQIIAHDASTGEIAWKRGDRYTGPLVMAEDWIISSSGSHGAFSIETGEPKQRLHPITGEEMQWTHTRSYGCGVALGCENLLTFRSGAAGFFDLKDSSGVGNFGGFRAGCTPNLIPADGVLNAPDYTRTCSCSYQNQTSLALISMPDVEIWTWTDLPKPEKADRVRQIGVNFGAPGNRQSSEGVYWINYPSVGGPSPEVKVRVRSGESNWFRNHSSQVNIGGQRFNAPTDDLVWVAASGVEGAEELEITLHDQKLKTAAKYRVRLIFSDPQNETAGERQFDVALQGKLVRQGLDIAAEAGGDRTPLVIEVADVEIEERLKIELTPSKGSAKPTVLSGVEIVIQE
ncbi:MAG: PQQ-binding-like beta-propeller repeat protein [Pirellulaceae bacterium]